MTPSPVPAARLTARILELLETLPEYQKAPPKGKILALKAAAFFIEESIPERHPLQMLNDAIPQIPLDMRNPQ